MPLSSHHKGRVDEVVAVDLGFRITKAVHLRRKGSSYHLLNFVLTDAPIFEKTLSPETLADHLKEIWRLLGARTRHLALAVGASDTVLAHAELPSVPPSDLRRMVKLSPKTYVQQDLAGHVFDCYARTESGQDAGPRTKRRSKALVTAAKFAKVENFKEAARQAGLILEIILPGQTALVNAFKALPNETHGDVVALLDVGFDHSTINIVMRGDLALTRIVNIGAEKFAQVMNQSGNLEPTESSHPESPLTEVMQGKFQNLVTQLAKEIDASIGFFVSQQETTVNQVYVSGGSARSQYLVQTLEVELGLPCEAWNPARALTLDVPPRKRQELEYDSSQIAVALGAGLALLDPELIQLNLLAEEQETAELRRRDPVRRGYMLAAAAVMILLGWAGYLGFESFRMNSRLREKEAELKNLEAEAKSAMNLAGRAGEMERTVAALNRQGTNRFLWAPILNSLQYVIVPGVEFHNLRVDLKLALPPPKTGVKPQDAASKTNKPVPSIEKMMMVIRAKNYAEPQAMERVIDQIRMQPYFSEHLQQEQPVVLEDVQPRQVDPADPNRTFVLFTTKCLYAERNLADE